MNEADLNNIRTLVAEYMQSEGCSCCRNYEKHEKDKENLAKVLNVPKYDDGSAYNFQKFRIKKTRSKKK